MANHHTHFPLARVWTIAGIVFLCAVLASRALTSLQSPMPAYLVGLVGLVAVGVALLLSWRGLGDSSAHFPFL